MPGPGGRHLAVICADMLPSALGIATGEAGDIFGWNRDKVFLQDRLKGAAILMINGAGRAKVGLLYVVETMVLTLAAFLVAFGERDPAVELVSLPMACPHQTKRVSATATEITPLKRNTAVIDAVHRIQYGV